MSVSQRNIKQISLDPARACIAADVAVWLSSASQSNIECRATIEVYRQGSVERLMVDRIKTNQKGQILLNNRVRLSPGVKKVNLVVESNCEDLAVRLPHLSPVYR